MNLQHTLNDLDQVLRRRLRRTATLSRWQRDRGLTPDLDTLYAQIRDLDRCVSHPVLAALPACKRGLARRSERPCRRDPDVSHIVPAVSDLKPLVAARLRSLAGAEMRAAAATTAIRALRLPRRAGSRTWSDAVTPPRGSGTTAGFTCGHAVVAGGLH